MSNAAIEAREKEYEHHLSAAPETLYPDYDLGDHDLFLHFCLNNVPLKLFFVTLIDLFFLLISMLP